MFNFVKRMETPDWLIFVVITMFILGYASLAAAGVAERAAAHRTVSVGYNSPGGTFSHRATGVMLENVGTIITADHVCEGLASATRPRIKMFDGTMSVVTSMTRSDNQDYYDICYLHVAPFVRVRDNWLGTPRPKFIEGARYGDHLFHVGMWREEWFIVEGIAGRVTPSGLNHNEVVPLYAHVGPGSSGGGVWSENGTLVGILVQARMMRTSRGGAFPLGIGYFIDLTK